jgi:hypothetical protein
MTLKRREKMLAGAALGVLGVVALYLLLMAGDSRTAGKLRTERDRLTDEVEAKNAQIAAALREKKRIAEWLARSLPSESVAARSLYKTWLTDLAKEQRISDVAVVSQEAAESKRNVPVKFAFTLSGRAQLSSLVKFLHAFYSAGHLHQIRHMDIKPKDRYLDLNLKIEAFSLPGVARKDTLSKEPGKDASKGGLQLAKASDYVDPIVARNFFAPYVAPDNRPRSAFDTARYAFVTGITEANGRREVWLQDRIAGKTYRLAEGAEFRVGLSRGKVKTITLPGEVIIEFDGRVRRLHEGEHLRGGVEVREEATGAKPPTERVGEARPQATLPLQRK